MKAVDFSETSVSINQSKQRNISEEFNLYRHHRENPEFYVFHHRQIMQEAIWSVQQTVKVAVERL